MNNEPEPARCKTCGIPLSEHLGLYGTCRELMLARAEVERLTAELARVEGELEKTKRELAHAYELGRQSTLLADQHP